MTAKKIKDLYVNFLLDESGSMGSAFEQTCEGFNAYVKQLEQGKAQTFFSFTKFNSLECKPSFVTKPIIRVPKLSIKNYKPQGGTPLYDAIGKAVSALERKITRDKLKGNFLFVIMTDGEENSSREYDRQTIFDLIKEKTKKGWEFAFMGADIDSWKAASAIGIARMSTKNYSKEASVEAFKDLANQTMTYSSFADGARGKFFSQANP